MLLGFLDGQGRTYDLTFGTLKRRLWDGDGAWHAELGETVGGGVSVEAAMFVQTPKSHLLLRPTSGTAHASDRRLVFLAAEDAERTPDEPTRFNVAIHAPPTAVDHLFRERGGREVLEIPRPEFHGLLESRAELTARIEAEWMGGQTATFLLILRPLSAGREAVAPLRLS